MFDDEYKLDESELEPPRPQKSKGVILTDVNEILDHFGISEIGNENLSVFGSTKIENIGVAVAFDLSKGKGRAVIDYDPAFPYAVLRICIDPITNSN